MILWPIRPDRRASVARAATAQAVTGRHDVLAALLAGALLLLAAHAHAMTHTRHAPVQSAGKAQAHALHEAGARSTRAAAKASTRHGRSTQVPLSGASRKGAAPPKHTRDTGTSRHSEESHRNSGAHTGRRRREPQYVDDPQLVHRAHSGRPLRDLHAQRAGRQLLTPQRPAPEPHAARALISQPAVLPAPENLPGNVARNNARHSAETRGEAVPRTETRSSPDRDTPAAAPHTFATGVSHPDDQERISLPASGSASPSGAPLQTRRPAPVVLARPYPGPIAGMTAAPILPAPPAVQPVEGFGGEVDFRSTRAAPSAAPILIAPPQGSPAEQARELRQAAEAASQPMFVPMYSREGTLVVPPPLKGSRTILVHQNQMADDAGLSRIQDDADLNRLRRAHLLLDLPENESLRINANLPVNRRAARPWTVRFVTDIAAAFYEHFGDPLQLTSAVRTVAYQLRLQRVNGNAAAVEGDGASPHLTGQAIDFGKRGMTVSEIAWMRSYLLPLIDAGKIDVEEEFQQSCFHISVYSSYVPLRKRGPARTEVAQITARPVHAHAAAPSAAEDDDDMR